jgi:hypothetical protein
MMHPVKGCEKRVIFGREQYHSASGKIRLLREYPPTLVNRFADVNDEQG